MLSDKTGFPNSWESLEKRELVYLLKLWLILDKKKDLSMQDVKRSFVSQIFTWRGIRKEKTIDYMLLVDEVSKTLDWAFSYDKVKKEAVINYDCIEFLFPKFGSLKGPQNYGGDLSFGEFRFLLMLFNEIGKGNDVENNIRRIAGTLYRQLDKSKRRRILFNADMNYIGNSKRMPEYIIYYAYLWFSAFCRYLMDGSFIIDGNEVNFACIFSGGESSSDNYIGMNSILFSVAESHVFGTVKDVDDAQLFRILLKLVDDKNKADELKKSMKL